MGFKNGDAVLQAMPGILSSAGQVAVQLKGSGQKSNAKEDAEALARTKELDAMEIARRERQQASKTTEDLRAETMRRKARARAMWGKSGVGLSGSAARVIDGMDSEAENKIQDIRGEADERAKHALSIGNDQAKSIRSKSNQYGRRSVDPFAVGQSILGLGKSLFDM